MFFLELAEVLNTTCAFDNTKLVNSNRKEFLKPFRMFRDYVLRCLEITKQESFSVLLQYGSLQIY